MAELDDKKDAAVEGLSRAISLLKKTELDQGMRDRGWTSDFAALIASTMSKSRTQVEEGWIPPRMYGGYWIRLMMDTIDFGEDPLAHSVYEPPMLSISLRRRLGQARYTAPERHTGLGITSPMRVSLDKSDPARMRWVIVRPANTADGEAIASVLNALLATTAIEWTDTPHTADSILEWLDQHETVLVAEEGAEVVGVAAFEWFRDVVQRPGYRFTVENTVHVREDHWGSGVGRRAYGSPYR